MFLIQKVDGGDDFKGGLTAKVGKFRKNQNVVGGE
jgi:hypothetical protein